MKNPNAIINSDYGPIIININDAIIGKQISRAGYWANDDIELIKQILNIAYQRKDILTFYDVGANIGTHSLALAKTYGNKIKIRAFEAQRQIFNMMCGTLAINGISNVYCHNLAVSDISGNTIEINLPDYGKSNNFGGLELIPAQRSDNQQMEKPSCEHITTTTLDAFHEHVDFLKMDIEGMEDKALQGCISIFRDSRPICFIEILKTDANFVTELLKSHNYIGFQKSNDLIAIPLEQHIQISGLQRIF